MKTTLFVFCLLLTTAAFGQYSQGGGSAMSAQPFIFESPSHPAHASYTPLATETSVVSGTGYAVGQGDRPFWDFPQKPEVSLGDQARELRKEHAQLVRKARVVYTNQ
jgi:hypothetical protein